MLLFRPSPIRGESLSSWRQRVGIANGFRLFPLVPGQLRRADPDFAGPVQLELLASSVGTSADQLAPLALNAYKDIVFDEPPLGRNHPRWIVPLRYSDRQNAHGSPFCPSCLNSDQVPYFRKSWRLGFVSECIVHRRELIDRCPYCRSSIWPSIALQTRHFSNRAVALWQCPNCLADLRSHVAAEAEVARTNRLLAIVDESCFAVGEGLIVSSVEFFNALAAIAHLFIRRRPRKVISSHRSRWKQYATVSASKCNMVEQLALPTRRQLVAVASDLLDDWPHQFLSFARQTGLQRQHFSGSESLHPSWIQSEIDRSLSLQFRGVTLTKVLAAAASLTQDGRKPTIADVNKSLGSKNATAVRKALGRRYEARADEFVMFLGAMQREIESESAGTRQQRIVCRNVVIVLCLLKGHGKEGKFLQSNLRELRFELRWALESSHIQLRDLAEVVLCRLELSCNLHPDGLPLRPHRGNALLRRAVADLIKVSMRCLDPRLLRNVSVFRHVVVLGGH